MAEPRVLVLRAAGINCDEETRQGFVFAGARAERVHVNRVLERPSLLADFGLVALPGGFSYGDHIAGGKVLALELEHALGDHLRAFVERGGLVLGICNGFQVLVKTRLLPDGVGGSTGAQKVTLSWNDSHRYEDRWVHLAVDPGRCVMAPRDRGRIALPVGHGEGRFTVAEGLSARAFVEDHRAVFRYIAADGSTPGGATRPVGPGAGPEGVGHTTGYPQNPNGSEADVAGLCDPSGQILGLMPHPDRALFPWNHPDWTRDARRTEGDGISIFRAAVDAMR